LEEEDDEEEEVPESTFDAEISAGAPVAVGICPIPAFTIKVASASSKSLKMIAG